MQWTWDWGKLRVIQELKEAAGDQGTPQACLISYRVENKDDRAHTVGIRAIIDSTLGGSRSSFAIDGKNEMISLPAEFARKAEIPSALRTLQNPDLKEPGLTSVLTLKPSGVIESPGRVVVASYQQSDEYREWEIPVSVSADYAAAVLYWNPIELGAGETRIVGFVYGLP